MRSYFVSRILILKSNKIRDYSAWRTHGAPSCCLHLGRGNVEVLSVRFFSPKTLVFLASSTGNSGKWHGLVEKK